MCSDKKKRIMLVEDEAIIAMMEKHLLEKYGYEVEIVGTGEQAVASFSACDGIDLLLMDIDLGSGIDGTETARIILRDHDVPVVFLSSHTEPEVVAKTEKISSYGYVVKNSGITILDASIKMAFKLFEANKRTRITRDQLKATFEALPDLLFEFRLDGYCHDFHAPDTCLAYKPGKEIVGKGINEILPDAVAQIVMSAILEANEKETTVCRQVEMAVPSAVLWFDISVSPKFSELPEPRFIILWRDVTARKQIDENLQTHQIELKMQNEELRRKQDELEIVQTKLWELYDMAPVSYICLDEAGLIRKANLLAATLLGDTRSALIGQPIMAFIHPDDQDSFHLFRRLLSRSGEAVARELRLRRRDGSFFPIQLIANSEGGKPGDSWIRMVMVQPRGAS